MKPVLLDRYVYWLASVEIVLKMSMEVMVDESDGEAVMFFLNMRDEVRRSFKEE